jgi:hypothetical protein
MGVDESTENTCMRLEKLEDKIEQVFAEQLAIYNSMKL